MLASLPRPRFPHFDHSSALMTSLYSMAISLGFNSLDSYDSLDAIGECRSFVYRLSYLSASRIV